MDNSNHKVAWLVAYEDHEEYRLNEIVFQTNDPMEDEEINSNRDYPYLTSRRMKKYDQYVDLGYVPPLILLKDDWWFFCCNCEAEVHEDYKGYFNEDGDYDEVDCNPVFVEDRVYCSEKCSLK